MDGTPSYDDELVTALQCLLDNGEISHETAVGIAKKIISDSGLERLSPKQSEVYETFIKPHLEPKCEAHGCGDTIYIGDIPTAYARRDDLDGLFCEECIHMKDVMHKDD
ncbi:hypothetical protein [Desulfocurvibacter africanus]|uniref:hypothetical protein n=1 Tax=Desulfocurvibacter africanus TaxID=873 RepID=UPI00110C6702|nr:hypothetical protein [Desulfocurvibacter africanus]